MTAVLCFLPLMNYNSARNSMLPILVSDNGIGIAKENHKKIFEIFSRLHNSSSQYEGVGMALTIVKRILERHNGRIWVESDLGEGTTFFFGLRKG